MNNFKYSNIGLKITEGFEGISLSSYQDGGGVWTIGYGHTLGVKAGDTCTQEQAKAWLLQDVQNAANEVNTHVTTPINQEEFDALTDFVFNLGNGNFQNSSLLRDINSGNFANAAADFEKWNKVAGQVCAGIMRRRVAEAAEFNSTDTTV
jgi:lysozyme